MYFIRLEGKAKKSAVCCHGGWLFAGPDEQHKVPIGVWVLRRTDPGSDKVQMQEPAARIIDHYERHARNWDADRAIAALIHGTISPGMTASLPRYQVELPFSI